MHLENSDFYLSSPWKNTAGDISKDVDSIIAFVNSTFGAHFGVGY